MARHLILVAIYALIGVPWYWSLLPENWAMQRIYGLPLWVAVSVAGSFGVSLHTCMIFCRPWPMELAGDDDTSQEAAPKP